ncbi:uncharacterized protein MONBRDRAFT_12450 [Monosiga brevicollis MX1]|uniref:Uncharacterized protein n=1 Tax=Monosiga brevicollis TaxID=81824 RepID=A9VCB2_MONBE|nr:uncharacterized protein MONBRDRAFT_12450 [Monosiga brevicollis MX1]EDQ84829.1 predicted protein [Monosiga brevicollis MX1]|eukprot:XP_001750330.1 hypothetical protein [Monosiga brevicollis MX1]
MSCGPGKERQVRTFVSILASTPCFNSISTTSTRPELQALCSGVVPSCGSMHRHNHHHHHVAHRQTQHHNINKSASKSEKGQARSKVNHETSGNKAGQRKRCGAQSPAKNADTASTTHELRPRQRETELQALCSVVVPSCRLMSHRHNHNHHQQHNINKSVSKSEKGQARGKVKHEDQRK